MIESKKVGETMHLFKQAVLLINRHTGQQNKAYPEEELHWLACTAHNNGLTAYKKASWLMAEEWLSMARELMVAAHMKQEMVDTKELFDYCMTKRAQCV